MSTDPQDNRCATCGIFEQPKNIVNGECPECLQGGTPASERRARIHRMSEALEAQRREAAARWIAPEGFDITRLEARGSDGRPIIIPDDERICPSLLPDESKDGK